MISLHSCFVAGLTLIYCIWRDRKLFSYEVVEATQSCSQILTIFGEKWPGAVKYRDIFDALSQSFFKLTLKSAEAISNTTSPLPGQLHRDTQPMTAVQGIRTMKDGGASESSQNQQTGKPTMSHLVTNAVKEAFMEVDEEAPGGWQGWRMWNEMIIDNRNSDVQPDFKLDYFDNQEVMDAQWVPNTISGTYGTDPVQDAATQINTRVTTNHGQWTLSDYR
jgi:hypothetical protein